MSNASDIGLSDPAVSSSSAVAVLPFHEAGGLDRKGRDRTVQRAEALQTLERIHQLAAGDPERAVLRDQVIVEYMPYARHLTRRFVIAAQVVEDVHQVAYLGLVKAVDGFDPNHGATFLTYATPMILGEIKRHFRDASWAVHVPRRIQELSCELRSATETLTARLNRAPTVHELAELLAACPDDVVDAIDANGLHTLASLDTPTSTDDGHASTLGDLLATEGFDIQHVINRETLRPLLKQLSPRDKQILLMRFFRTMTQAQIGDELGVSQMQVSRLLSAIIGRLRQSVVDAPAPPVANTTAAVPADRASDR